MAKTTDNLRQTPSGSALRPTGRGIVLDLGTGDGRFVYQSARENPHTFYIGIDANPGQLEKISEQIHRKPTKGGAPNLLFLQAAAEALPPELDGVANEVHVHFPWGSLLRAVATGDAVVLQNLRRVCAPEALVEIVIGHDPTRDQTELQALGIPELTQEFLETRLVPRYEECGFHVLEYGVLGAFDWSPINTSWAKRLHGGAGRGLVYLIAQARAHSA